MPTTQCRTCGRIVTDLSRPCPSCGNMYDESPKTPSQSPVYSSADAYKFSIGVVLSRSFSTLLKHQFVFVGLSLLALIPGIILMVLMRNSTIVGELTSFVNSFLGLAIQGAIAYGVYEALRGNRARLGESLRRGMARIIPLGLGTLSFGIFLALVVIGSIVLINVIGGIAIFVIPPVLFLTLFVLLCKWSVFVQACVVERLGPIQSLNRSSILTKGCRLKIAALYTLNFVIAFAVMYIWGFIAKKAGIGAWTSYLLQQLVNVAPIAFGQVMTAVMYYELRNVKEGISVDQLANVFD